MIWNHHASSHWKCFDFKDFVIEAKVVEDKNFSVWRVVQDGIVLAKGKQSSIIGAMNASVIYAQSLVVAKKSKSKIIKEFCEECGIPYKDMSLIKETNEEDTKGFPEPVSDISN